MAAYSGVLHSDTSDLTPFVDENREIKQAITTATLTVSLSSNETQYWGFITESGVPNNVRWEQGGTWTIEYRNITGNHQIQGRCRCVRVDNGGTILESGTWTAYQNLDANKTFTPTNPNWNRDDEDATNRLAVEFEFDNTQSMVNSCQFGTNTIDDEVITNITSGLVWTQANSGIELFVEGFQTGTSVSGNIDLYVNGLGDINNNIDLLVRGHQNINSNIDLIINSHQNTNDDIALLIYGWDTINDNINIFIEGHQSESNEIGLLVSGIISATQINKNITLNTYGHQNINNNIRLFINGLNSINNLIALNIDGHELVDNNTTLFVNGLETQIDSIELIISGHIIQNNTISLFTNGLGFIIDDIPLYVSSINTTTGNIILLIDGPGFESNNVNLYIKGFASSIDQMNLFINGHQEINGSIILFTLGAQSIIDNTLCYIKGLEFNNDNIDLFVLGHDPFNNNIELFVGGHLISNNNTTLFIDGSGVVPTLITGELELYITGPTSLPINNDITCIINGYIPIPETECPTLDPTASIQITSDLVDIYQSRIDALINQLGKHVLLEFDPNRESCSNCIFDPIRQRSTGIYITNPPGPRPFKRNRKCPHCKGRGYEETPNTKCIDALIKWNPKNAKNYGITLTNRKDVVRIKTYITEADDLIRAKTAIIDYDQRNITIARAKMIKSPIPVGLRDSRYCISFWELL